MTTYATGNPLGSKDPRDLYDNAENFDAAMNDRVNTTWNDRFGVSRPTMKGYEEQFNDWLDAQGFEPGVLEYVDGSPLTVDRPTQLIQRGDNIYSVKRPASFPVNLTGNWATDQNLLVAQVDQSLRQQLAEPGGMQMIGALDGKVGDYLPNRIHVRKFGVVGDGVTDDSNALEAAIMAGVPIDFGNLHIRITRSIGNQATIPASIDWKASGAKIFMDSSTIKESVLYFSVLPLDHRIEGPLFIDGASKAFAGIYLRNNSTDFYPLGYGTMFASDLRVENIRRADATYANGDGILIRGGFTSVTLIRPIVRNVILAPGAGTPGMVGVSGIAVFGNSDGIGYPRTVTIVDPYIENVSSEDPSYLDDMDGIRVFGPHAVTPGVNAIDSTFTITRGVFRNCSGRSIKSQMTTGQVIGGKFIRTTGPASGIGNEEIAFQQGGGYVEDIICLYYGGNVPSTVINGGEGAVERRRPSLKVKGVYVANHSSPAIPQIVQTFSPGVSTGLISVEDVEVQGPVDRLVEYLVNGDLNALKVANVTVDGLTTELIRAKSSGSSTPFGGKVYAENCINNGTLRPMLTHRVAGNAVVVELSEYGCVGFTRNGSADTSLVNPGSVMRPYAIAGAGQSVGGSMRVQSVNIEPGNVGQIQGHGVNNGVCFAIISINRNSSSNGAVSISSTGVVALAVGSDITVGGTSEPASGLFRVWSQASGGGTINIRNGDTSTRAVTLFSFG
ncbi:hypothetical protein [Pseudomonas aeruginosa]|uniref:hypothetical protein n=1 Tax=Pseudomonas aeruginosa TaxID=287 RepID=UPI0034579518